MTRDSVKIGSSGPSEEPFDASAKSMSNVDEASRAGAPKGRVATLKRPAELSMLSGFERPLGGAAMSRKADASQPAPNGAEPDSGLEKAALVHPPRNSQSLRARISTGWLRRRTTPNAIVPESEADRLLRAAFPVSGAKSEGGPCNDERKELEVPLPSVSEIGETSRAAESDDGSETPDRPATPERPAGLAMLSRLERPLVRTTTPQKAEVSQAVRNGAEPTSELEDAAPTQPPGNPKSLRARIASAFSGRRLTLNVGLPGTARTIDRPLRAALPVVDAKPEGPARNDDLMAEAQNLSKIAGSLLASVGRPEAALWRRPAPSTVRKWATKVVPWLKPAALADVAIGASASGKTSTPYHRSESRQRGEIAATAKEVLADIERRRRVVQEAMVKLTQASEAHDDSRSVAPRSQQTLDLALQRSEAAAQVRDASRSLHDAIASTNMVGLTNLSYLAEQDERSAGLVRTRVAELLTLAHAIRADAYDRRDAIDLELRARTEEARALMSVDHDLAAAEKTIAEAQARLAVLQADVPALTADEVGSSSGQAGAANESRLDQIEWTQFILAYAEEAQQYCFQQLENIESEFAQLNERITTLMRQRPLAEQQRDEAERSLSLLTEASSRLAKQGAAAAPEEPADTDAIAELESKIVAYQAEQSHAFGPTPHAGLQSALDALASRLPETGALAKLPPVMAMEVVTQGLADVTGGDPERALRALDAMRAMPTLHWVQLAQQASESQGARSATAFSRDGTAADAMALSRRIAALPRGADLLHTLSSEAEKPADKEGTQALHVFWVADDAQRNERGESVAAWLGQAKRVALAGCSGDTETLFDDVDHAAYRAVRNGYISNAPGSVYDQHNQRMMKAITEWVVRAAATSAKESTDNGAPRPSGWRRLMPTMNKSPFRKRAINRAFDVSESMGLNSARLQVDRAVKRRMTSLEPMIALSRQSGGGQGTLDALFAQAFVDHLKRVDKRGRHLSKVKLTASDAREIKKRLPKSTQRAHRERFQAFFDDICAHGSTAFEALNRIDERLRKNVPAQLHPPVEESTEEDLAAALQLMKARRFSDRKDVISFFKPFILDMALRDKVRVGGGGTLGIGLPTLPYWLVSPIASPIVSAEVSRSEEAFTQLFMPVLGIEMMFGKTRTNAKEAALGVAAGKSVVSHVALQGTFSVHGAKQKTETSATLMRFFRRRHEDDAMRGKMFNALDSLVRWDMIEPERGRAFNGPLEAVFARNPDVSVSQVDAVADTTSLGAAVTARLPYVSYSDKGGDGIGQTFRLEPSVGVEANRVRDLRIERGGHVAVVGARGDTAEQRANVGFNASAAPVSYQPLSAAPPPHQGQHVAASTSHHGPHGAVQRETAVPLQLGIVRDIAWALERHEISPFLLDGKQDGDLDRHYSTPADMLHEIQANREHWLLRCIETLEPDAAGNVDTPDNRVRAAMLLEAFEREIKELGKTSNYCQYNVNYSMRGAASAWIDGYRGLQVMARRRGDAEAERRASESIDEILLMRGTWRPLMLIVREKAKDSTSIGWRNLLRWQRTADVDGQRTAAQFPPP